MFANAQVSVQNVFHPHAISKPKVGIPNQFHRWKFGELVHDLSSPHFWHMQRIFQLRWQSLNWYINATKRAIQNPKQKPALRGKWKSSPLVPHWVALLLGGDVQHIWNVWLPGHYLHQRADHVINEQVDQPTSRTQNRPVPIAYDTVPSSLNSWHAKHFPELCVKS